MIKIEDVQKFWSYVWDTFEKEEVDNALDAFEFERKYMEKEELKKLPSDELRKLYSYLVYIVLNELGDGDFYTMYDVLADNMGLCEEDISFMLDY